MPTQKLGADTPIRLALFGYGKMGRAIHALAIQQGIEVPLILKQAPLDTQKTIEELRSVDVCIDFSRADALMPYVSLALAAQKPLVIGTTNWQDQLDNVKKKTSENTIGVIYGANFAIGMQLFFQIVRHASHLLSKFQNYDVGGVEWHHVEKLDSPSGTTRELTQIVLEETPHKTHGLFERVEGRRPEESVPFVSLRSGYCPGMHTLFFDSPYDTIELRHTTRSREGLASGALTAARWILSKKGLYTVEDMIKDMQKS